MIWHDVSRIRHCLPSKSIAEFLTVISAKSAANDSQRRAAWFMMTPVLDLIVRIARVRWAGVYFRMAKRVCYVHVGPHKTGSTSIQWFLQENGPELLKHGYFVPESETKRGAHHALAEGLAGLDVGEHREPLVARSIAAIAETPAQAIIISSEALEGLLKSRQHTETFFNRVHELSLKPKLILFPRNQPQWINSSYASSVKSFRRSDSFQPGVLGFAQSPGARFSRWIQLAETHGAELIARPFSMETLRRGVIPEFLRSIGITSSQFRDRAVRRNEAVGPFTVSVAREVLRSIGKEMTWLQAKKCKVELADYLRQNNCTDAAYCGLSTTFARHVEEELRSDNDLFAQAAWGKSWADVFAADVTEQFVPNDFEMRRPDWFTTRRLRRAISKMTDFAHQILLDPALAVKAPWNDVAHRSGLVSRE
jgi:hypothetical protein